MRRVLGLLLAAALVMAGGGCAAVVVGGAAAAGTIIYVKGKLESTVEAPLDRTYEATLAAIEELEFSLQEHRKDALGARVSAETARRRHIGIDLTPFGDEATEVSIRVGAFGDKKVSTMILNRIRGQLGLKDGPAPEAPQTGTGSKLTTSPSRRA